MSKALENVEYNGRVFSIDELIVTTAKTGVFKIEEIEQRFVTEENKNIYKGYKVGQELTPLLKCVKAYKGGSFEEIEPEKWKVSIFDVADCYKAKANLSLKKSELQTKVDNIKFILEQL